MLYRFVEIFVPFGYTLVSIGITTVVTAVAVMIVWFLNGNVSGPLRRVAVAIAIAVLVECAVVGISHSTRRRHSLQEIALT